MYITLGHTVLRMDACPTYIFLFGKVGWLFEQTKTYFFSISFLIIKFFFLLWIISLRREAQCFLILCFLLIFMKSIQNTFFYWKSKLKRNYFYFKFSFRGYILFFTSLGHTHNPRTCSSGHRLIRPVQIRALLYR